MAEIILSFPIMSAISILQATIFSRIHILHGNADIIMVVLIAWMLNPHTKYSWIWVVLGGLMMTYLSALPLYGYFIIYFLIGIIIFFLKKIVWQMPMILMVFMTIVGSMLSSVVSFGILTFTGNSYSIRMIVSQVMIPSLIFNLLLAFPVYGLLNDLAGSLYLREGEA